MAFTTEDLFATAARVHDGTLASGAFSARAVYDAAELGLHLLLLRVAARTGHVNTPSEALDVLEEVNRLPAQLLTQTQRSQAQQAFQQFSTPASYAFVYAWAAGLRKNDVMLEPSAGTGAPLVWALAADARVVANELSRRRATLLNVVSTEAGHERPAEILFRENAEYLHAVLPPRGRPTVVLMNPPFSQTAERLSMRRVAGDGSEHVRQALLRLRYGGRLVDIVGPSVERGSASHATLIEQLDVGSYALRADVEGDSRLYCSSETAVATRVLIVDKVEQAEGKRAEAEVRARAGSPETLLKLLHSVRNTRWK